MIIPRDLPNAIMRCTMHAARTGVRKSRVAKKHLSKRETHSKASALGTMPAKKKKNTTQQRIQKGASHQQLPPLFTFEFVFNSMAQQEDSDGCSEGTMVGWGRKRSRRGSKRSRLFLPCLSGKKKADRNPLVSKVSLPLKLAQAQVSAESTVQGVRK